MACYRFFLHCVLSEFSGMLISSHVTALFGSALLGFRLHINGTSVVDLSIYKVPFRKTF